MVTAEVVAEISCATMQQRKSSVRLSDGSPARIKRRNLVGNDAHQAMWLGKAQLGRFQQGKDRRGGRWQGKARASGGCDAGMLGYWRRKGGAKYKDSAYAIDAVDRWQLAGYPIWAAPSQRSSATAPCPRACCFTGYLVPRRQRPQGALDKEVGWAYLSVAGPGLLAAREKISKVYAVAKDIRPCIIFIEECSSSCRRTPRSSNGLLPSK